MPINDVTDKELNEEIALLLNRGKGNYVSKNSFDKIRKAYNLTSLPIKQQLKICINRIKHWL